MKKMLKLMYILINEILIYVKSDRTLEILKLSHSLEKGMGLPNVKSGFGVGKSKKLILLLEEEYYRDNCDKFAIYEGIVVLESYLNNQGNNEVLADISVRLQRVKEKLENSEKGIFNNFRGGCSFVEYESVQKMNGIDFLASRHSIRDYDLYKKVNLRELKTAIKIAAMAPSACNRQPSKIYYTLNREKAKQIGELIPGNNGFEENIPYYAVITVDRKMFETAESLQWYINGGIFIAYFVYGLHYAGIGSCIFQVPFGNFKQINALYSIIEAPRNEAICAVIGFGKCKNSSKILCAQRKGVSDVSKEI